MASVSKRPNGMWLARYRRVPGGPQTTKTFKRKVDAQNWLDEVTASIVTGQYVAPKAGKITLEEYAEQWRATRMHRHSTAVQVEGSLRRYVYPYLGNRPLESILPSDIQGLVRRLSATLSPSTVRVVHRHLSAILKAAVKDRRIASSPCVGTSLPKVSKARVVPISTEQVRSLVEAVPKRQRALVVLAAGTGMRQGEVFGLTVDRVDFLRRTVRVDRQMSVVNGQAPVFGPPKTEASVRDIPLPKVVVEALAEHLSEFPVGPDGLVFTGREGQPYRRSAFWASWQRATKKAGLEGFTFHGLRHYYASLLIRHGESVKTVQARLGHASASETLDTYSHLWPDSDDRTREAVDLALGTAEDSLRTEATGS